MKIRPATINDIQILTTFRINLLRDIGKIIERYETKELISDTEKYFATALNSIYFGWVAEVRNLSVGTGGLIFARKPPTPSGSGIEAQLINIYTLPEFRRQGIASALALEIVTYVRLQGISRICLNTSKGGRPIYERLGFVNKENSMILN